MYRAPELEATGGDPEDFVRLLLVHHGGSFYPARAWHSKWDLGSTVIAEIAEGNGWPWPHADPQGANKEAASVFG
jgi:hypothetical protein